MNKIHSYGYNEDLFLKSDVIRDAKDHGFIFILDWSGSMAMDLAGTIHQLLRMTTFCKNVGIPYEVYVFRTYHGGGHSRVWDHAVKTIVPTNSFEIDNILSSRMKASEYNQAMETLVCTGGRGIRNFMLGSTPLNETIMFQEVISISSSVVFQSVTSISYI